jgi:diguanylate cyclase (GGDEF)-like protein/PAS domain S-box-containing protein
VPVRSQRLVRSHFAVGVALGAVYFTLPESPLRTSMWIAIALLPVVAIIVGVRQYRPARPLPWILIAVGQLAFACGDAIFYWQAQVLHLDVAVPSVSDPLYLAMYPCLAGGVAIFARRRSPEGDPIGLLDALIITVGLALLSWVFLINPFLGADTMGVATRLTSIAYPLGDVLVLAVFARLGSDRGGRGRSFAFLAFGLLSLLTADSLYAWQQFNNGGAAIGTGLDAGWFLFYFGVGAAAVHPSMRELDAPAAPGLARISRGRFAILLAVASLLVPMVVTVRSASAADLPVFIGTSILLFALVLTRMAGLVRTLRELHHQRSEGRFQRLTDQVTDVLTICDRDATIRYQTPSVERLLGFAPATLTGTSLVSLIHPDDADRVAALLDSHTETGRIGPVECRMRRVGGGWVTCETLGRVVDDEDLRGYVLTTRDITERKMLEEQLTHRAFHDELTGLANRALLADRVQHALERRGTPYRHLAVLVVDIDDFKTVNDSLGRAIGDEMLRAVAERLRSCLRAADTAARLGGDEFAMLLDNLDDTAEAARVADRVLATMRQPMSLNGRTIEPRASVGIALADPDRLPDADELLRNADVAMHMAKRQGRNRFAYFAPSMHTGLMQKLDLAADLRGAIERRELMVYYQPLVDLFDGSIVGAEALVRWRHPVHGFIPPDGFIPLAEETGLVLPLGYEVLDTACRQAASWQWAGPMRVSVNLSPRQVQDPALLLYVRQALVHSGLPADALTLEITESLLSEDAEVALHRLRELKGLGVRLAVDDFGTGYSSLSRLRDFPIDILKIPKPFVDGVARGPEHSALARAILDLSAALGLQVIAEGIEHGEQSTELRRLGCRIGQGFHFAPAVPADDFNALLVNGRFPIPHPSPL